MVKWIRLAGNQFLEEGDVIHIDCGYHEALYIITKIKDNCLTVELLNKFFILKKQFNNVLFKMWER